MTYRFTRRLLLGSALLYPALAFAPAVRAAETDDDVDRRLAELEKKTGGRLGVSVLDTATSITFGYRGTERFAMCSTFKVLASALVLSRVDKGEDDLERRIVYGSDKLVTYSPMTEKHVGGEGMTLAEICKAGITLSDNTAGNLMLESFGGPQALTDWLRSIGDASTRLDRTETALNEARKDDPRDTTTPDAMLDTLGNILTGSVLSEGSRTQLIDWMVANTTGDARLRAGLPREWKIGDKTGTGDNGSAGDVAIVLPEDRSPILIAAYIAEATVPLKDLNDVFAEIGRVTAEMV